ncbi:MAG TPA: GGDEF domain-containing protein, partial [Rhodanobacteraceae bacterium]|nr:GGDEF domain-containing protein [Rhodanobacteraceae bacterium]
RVRHKAMPHPDSPVAPVITVSVGVSAVQPEETQSSDVLISAADHALYMAKAQGRDRVVAQAGQIDFLAPTRT